MKLIILLFIFSSLGCASYLKRKDCDNINWFNHGREIAMRGEWINSDKTVLECRKVEANIEETQLDLGFKNGVRQYCHPENSYLIGKSGSFFSPQLCEGPELNTIKNSHERGVRDYCAKSNSENAGASGKKYQNICPANLEKDFLPGYRKGRKRYVTKMVEIKSLESTSLNNEANLAQVRLAQSRGRISPLQSEVNSLETQKSFLSSQVASNPNTSSMISHLQARISSLNSEISSLNSQIMSEENTVRNIDIRKKTLQDEINAFQQELPSLEP